MATATFHRFITIASQYRDLIRDLCAQQDVIDRAQLLHYLETHHIPAGDKDPLIKQLCDILILQEEGDQEYTINPAVAELVNFYERRGRLTNAAFLRDQIAAIADQTDEIQRQIANEDVSNQTIADTVDSLYRLVREVRQSGDEHFFACMRYLGDMKRSSGQKTVDERLTGLETVQRRHINPLVEIIDPDGAYANQMRTLKRRITELSSNVQLLAESQEIDSHRRRLIVDLKYIENTLLARLIIVADTARALFKALIEERNIKRALAHGLANLELLWTHLEGQTIIAPQHQFTQAPSKDDLGDFFSDIVHKRLLPDPRPLQPFDVEKTLVDNEVILRQQDIVQSIRQKGYIESWPHYVVAQFTDYSERQQLRAITWPLIDMEHPIQIQPQRDLFEHHFGSFSVRLDNFGLRWEEQE